MSSVKRIKIPTFTDERGSLSAAELKDYIDWIPERIYYVTDVKKDRGGHAVIGEKKIYICVQGEIMAKIHDGKEWSEYKLQGPEDALIMEEVCYREFKDFSPGAVLLSISNMNYDKSKYIYDFDKFVAFKKSEN